MDTILENKFPLSILNIRKQANCFFFAEVTTINILKLIKCININRTMGEEQMPPKLVKIPVEF